MWLINTTTLELHDFIDAEHTPPYAILSHCWGDGEVSFKDFRKKRNCSGPGYDKIVQFCEYVRRNSYAGKCLEWAWIDTCCIDKRSSAELSEAINGMWTYYGRAAVCYAYLADVEHGSVSAEFEQENFRTLTSSRWFTRGWTLQELLAPADLLFLSLEWIPIGKKSHHGKETLVTRAIASSTGIPRAALIYRHSIRKGRWSVAQRMSWASKRKTTRAEDEAYCLFGLFNINLPLLYGEGRGAFQRLQLEILRQELGDSMFALRSQSSTQRKLLPDSPHSFGNAGGVLERPHAFGSIIQPKGQGFELTIPPFPQDVVHGHRDRHELLVYLNCALSVSDVQNPPRCILLLEYRASCRHFRAQPGPLRLDGRHSNTIYTEDDILDPWAYRAVQAAGVVYVHADSSITYSCKRIQAYSEGPRPGKIGRLSSHGLPPDCADPQRALDDAKRFNIR